MKKNKLILRKIMISRIWLTIFAILVCVLLFNSISLFLKRVKVWKKVEHLKHEKTILIERKNIIQTKKESLETHFGKEAVFRERFNVALPGEEVIIVTEAKPLVPQKKPGAGFILFFKNLFK